MHRVKLITETSYDCELFEDAKSKNLYIVGLYSAAEIENSNKRTYPKSILEREISKYMTEKVANKTAVGQLNHPASPETDLEKAAILVESLEWRGKDVYGKAKILSTPHGQIAKALIEDGVKLGISSRGLGTVSEAGQVNEDYRLITYDLVASPSTPGGWMNGIYEAETFVMKEIEKEVDRDQVQKEYYMKVKQFLTKLDEDRFLQLAPVSGPQLTSSADVLDVYDKIVAKHTAGDPAVAKAFAIVRNALAAALYAKSDLTRQRGR